MKDTVFDMKDCKFRSIHKEGFFCIKEAFFVNKDSLFYIRKRLSYTKDASLCLNKTFSEYKLVCMYT